MHDKPTGASDDERAPTAAQDLRDQGRVLDEVLALHPEALTLDEVVREVTRASAEFDERDRVERAVRDLAGGGLLHRNGDLVLPTRAAVLFHALAER
jgi:hypothetical protein